jgi:hypothetical protein
MTDRSFPRLVLPWYNLGMGRIKPKKAAHDTAKIPGRNSGPIPSAVTQPIAKVRPSPGTVMITCPGFLNWRPSAILSVGHIGRPGESDV